MAHNVGHFDLARERSRQASADRSIELKVAPGTFFWQGQEDADT
jgi:hypothetical protein